MLALLSAFLLFAVADLTRIYEKGTFSPYVGLVNSGLEDNGHIMSVNFNPPRCLESFVVSATEETPVTVQTVAGSESGLTWETIGTAILTAENQKIEIENAPHCVSSFRIVLEKGSFDVVDAEAEIDLDRKRGISCTYSATDQWPNTCKSSSAGTKCLQASSSCGCQYDGDCYADVSHPFCDLPSSTCVKCTNAPMATTPLQDGYACRLRFPSKYYADMSLTTKTQTPGFNLIQFTNGEQIPTNSYFKELCITGANSGACERCDQASTANIPSNNLVFPDYSTVTTGTPANDPSFQDGLRGSFFCKNAYGTGSPHPTRPICISTGLFTGGGLSTVFNTYTLNMEIGYCGSGTTSSATGATPCTDPAQQNVNVVRGVFEWEGACGPCVLNGAGGATIQLHTVCSFTQATSPICDSSVAVGCRACKLNSECAVATANCISDGSGSCTGGRNCQLDGSCHTCTSDADCGALDGGETTLQAKCDLAAGSPTQGQCIDQFSCTGNLGEGTAKDCSAANGGSNCYKNGSCKTCLTNADCGFTDGGTTKDQQVCVAGICKGCTLNSDCIGTSGANCEANGACIDCTNTTVTVCGANDGGASTPACTAAYCADANGQTICNSQNKLCESPCLSNNWCSLKKTAQPGITTNNGANCGSNGICADCQTPGSASTVANSPNCGSVDGPPTGLAGTSGKAGQTSCDTTGICVDPFTCTNNPSCSGSPGAPYSCADTTTSCANCQTSGSCVPCIVDYTSSTCGTQDGGEVTGQVNCQQSSRQCVAACTQGTTNSDCAGTQGANCMANGLCFNCRSDADCATSAPWGGDLGGSTVCQSNICVPACASNGACGANQNCMKDGRCRACGNNTDCVSNDGPPPMGTDIVCASGVCVPPYQCSSASTPADNNGCKTSGTGNNCMADKSCKTCTKDSDCIGDGGFKPNQPKCDVPSGTCVDCAANGDCLGTGTPLNCDGDGLCRDCRNYPSPQTCGTQDGPPGTPAPNPNCDSLTGICVDFCTKDADCLDTCAPRCNLERGCCVECLVQTDCPVAQWRGTQKSYTFCTADWMCALPPTPPPPPPSFVCETDSDCSGTTPACDFARQVCVACMADAHCKSSAPACQIGSRKCVDCTDDTYCTSQLDANGNPKVCGSSNTCEDSGSALLSISLFTCLLLALMRLF